MSQNHIHIDPDQLIQAVKGKPMIYNKDHPQFYHDKKNKAKIWADICKEVVPSWAELKPQERVECCHEAQKRWKSLRTCFGREIAEQHRESIRRQKNLPIKRRKVYGYFKDMSFLLPFYNATNRTSRISMQEAAMEEDDVNDDDPLDSAFKTEVVYEPRAESDVLDSDSFQDMYGQTNHDKVEFSYTKDEKKDEDDEDRQFLLSLVPTFKKFDDKQKFEAKIEILKVLKNVSFAPGSSS